MPVNLIAPLDKKRYNDDALAQARGRAQHRNYVLVRTDEPDDRLSAWIDLTFAPSFWSSETRVGNAWYATLGNEIVGFCGFGARGLHFPWLKRWNAERDVGIFGPYGVHPDHRGKGVGEALLIAAMCGLTEMGYKRALIPAVNEGSLAKMYEKRISGAAIVDRYDYDPGRRFRTVILASGVGSNAQVVMDRVRERRLPLELAGVIANHADAPVLDRAREANVDAAGITWDKTVEPREVYDGRLIHTIKQREPELILLLGWMHLLPAVFLMNFPDTLNLHPSFLPFDPTADAVTMPDGTKIPAFRGAHAIRDQATAGSGWSGVSVHRVTEKTDRGAILVRTPLRLDGEVDEAGLLAKLRPLEHAAVTAAIRRWVFERP